MMDRGDERASSTAASSAAPVTDAPIGEAATIVSPPFDGRLRRWGRRLVIAGAALVGLVLLVVVGSNLVVNRTSAAYLSDDPATVPERPVAIVFGAGLEPDGTPSMALRDRLDAAVAAYRAGRVPHLLMTGDNSSVDYDEVTAMRDYVVARGVPASAVTRDHAGFDTYDSCYRARDIFGVHAAVLITQDYHLPRAVYVCRGLGIDAVGLQVPDWQYHPERMDWTWPGDMARSYTVREWLSRVKAVQEIVVTHPQPTFGGPFVGLDGS